jgi:signal transduction histidine kinase
MRRSQVHEKESLEFSRDFIKGQEDERRRIPMELHDVER